MKKILSCLVAVITIITVTATPVLACGHYNKQSKFTIVCTVEDCLLTNLHSHNNINYNGHYYNDGHDYHDYCEIENCVIAGYHNHDDQYCFGHTQYDGHSYHRNSKHH